MTGLELSDTEKLAVQETFAAATRAGDVDASMALFEPDAEVWHNHDEVAVGVELAGRGLAWIHRRVPDATWEDLAVLPTPEGFLWRALMTGHCDGKPIRIHTCSVVTLASSARLRRIDEYVDGAALASLWQVP